MDDVLIADPQLHLPIDQPVKLLLRSKDVLHNFTVAQFRVKMDLVPGIDTYMWFTPTREGGFDVLCEELCGMAHHTMRGRVIVESRENFDTWLGAQPTYSDMLNLAAGNAQAGKNAFAPCVACHGQNGEGNLAMNAPKLSGMDEWYLRKQLSNYKAMKRGADPSDVLGAQMRGMAATLADAAAINNVVAYIGTLDDVQSEATISGDISHGEDLYQTCVNCHGAKGQGIWAMNAPRIAGMSDWYTANQLRNFRDGLRGVHPDDFYGQQMAQISKMLDEDEEITDLVAYLNTLGGVAESKHVAGIERTESFK
jgi:cytochrome c oxidase subunit 2